MQIDFFGANCLRIKTNTASLVFDDNLASLGGKSVTTNKDVSCITNDQLIDQPPATGLVFSMPGAYEVGGIRLTGIAANSHVDEPEKPPTATIFKGIIDESRLTFLVVGHIAPQLNDSQLELIGHVDILIIPVGGHGYTLDATAVTEMIKKTDPRLIIPTHYQQSGLKFSVPQATVDDFIKSSGLTSSEVEGTLRAKRSGFTDQPTIVVVKPKA